MSTLLEILQKTTAYFAGKGIPNPKLNAELLLAHVLQLRRLDLYLQFDRPLNADQLDTLRPLVARRGKREPLEYIVGNRPFVGLDLLCDARALIPRSETEELVELLAERFSGATSDENGFAAKNSIGLPEANCGSGVSSRDRDSEANTSAAPTAARSGPSDSTPTATNSNTATDGNSAALCLNANGNAARSVYNAPLSATNADDTSLPPPLHRTAPRRILDLGTGTGALALALAQTFPQAEVTAVDYSADTLALARANAARNGLEGRVRFILSDWFAAFAVTEKAPEPQSAGSPKLTGLKTPNTAEASDPDIAGTRGNPTPASHPAQFDLIVSNPPYLTEEEWQQADPEVKTYEPYRALVAPEDGLADLRRLITEAPHFLRSGGLLALETGIAHHEALAAIATATNAYAATESLCDSDARPRFFLAYAR